MVSDFYGLLQDGLQEKLGGVLFQFPPNFSFTEDHLQRIIDSVDPSFENVAEFRHRSWWNTDAIEKLGRHQIAYCGMSHPDFPTDVIGNTSHLYYRMHGYDQLYASGFSQMELTSILNKVQMMKDIERAYIYFNNDINGFATQNAERLIKLTIDT